MSRRDHDSATEGVPGWERRLWQTAKRVGILLAILVGLILTPMVISFVRWISPAGREQAEQFARDLRLDNNDVYIYTPERIYTASSESEGSPIRCLTSIGGAFSDWERFRAVDYDGIACGARGTFRPLPEEVRVPIAELMQLKYVLGMGKARFIDLDDDDRVDCIVPARHPDIVIHAADGAHCGGDPDDLQPLAPERWRQASEAMVKEAEVVALMRKLGIDRVE